MLLSPEMLLPTGPPPQAVLDKRWLWNVLLVLLGATFFLRLIGLDIAGALLSGLMLCFAIIMTRDGMQEIAKYALVYSVLCGLNFFFDILPLIGDLGGRESRLSDQPDTDGPMSIFRMQSKITPFFDFSMGVIYNVQSLSMLLSPIAMALGVYLAMSAHNEIQRHALPFWETDFDDFGRPFQPPPQQSPPTGQGGGGGAGGTRNRAGAAERSTTPSTPRPPGTSSASASGRETYERFSGVAYKLDDD
mmetsp:Transcript_11278/g.30235  ORF Transcript_11278/g.30235 Transcript_11278/m.30235 type:complete len:247 (+) Transcript_11278:77-817(+)